MSTTTKTTETKTTQKPASKAAKNKEKGKPKQQQTKVTTTTTQQKKPNKSQRVPKHLYMDPKIVKAARAWILHLGDPFNYPPVSIGGTGTPNHIWGSYGFTNTPSIVASATDFVAAMNFGYLAASTGNGPVTNMSSTGSGTTWGTVTSSYYANNSNANVVVGQSRPISAAMRITFKFGSSVTPPQLYGGQIPSAGGGPNATTMASNPSGLFTSPTNHKGGPTCTAMQACWVPQDFYDLDSFENLNTGTLSSTVPYVAATEMAAQTFVISIEFISFYEFQPGLLSQAPYYTPTEQAPYVVAQMWEAYIRLTNSGEMKVRRVIENPKTRGHTHGAKYGLRASSVSEAATVVNAMPEFPAPSSGVVGYGLNESTWGDKIVQASVAAASLAASQLLSQFDLAAQATAPYNPPPDLKEAECVGCGVTVEHGLLCGSCKLAIEQSQRVHEEAGVTSVHTTPEQITRKLDVLKRELMGVPPPVRNLINAGITSSKPVTHV